jgi:hypothetical protein
MNPTKPESGAVPTTDFSVHLHGIPSKNSVFHKYSSLSKTKIALHNNNSGTPHTSVNLYPLILMNSYQHLKANKRN